MALRSVKIAKSGEKWQLESYDRQPWTAKDKLDLEQTNAFRLVELGGKGIFLTPLNTHKHELLNAFLVVYMRFEVRKYEKPFAPLVKQAKKWTLALQTGF